MTWPPTPVSALDRLLTDMDAAGLVVESRKLSETNRMYLLEGRQPTTERAFSFVSAKYTPEERVRHLRAQFDVWRGAA